MYQFYTEGYISIKRNMLENPLMHNHLSFTYLIYCYLRAVWKDKKFIRNGKKFSVIRGSFVTTQSMDCYTLNISKGQRNTAIKILTDCGDISVKTSPAGSLIEVRNWANENPLHDNLPAKNEENQKPTGNLLETYSKPTGNLQETYKKPTGNLQETYRKQKNNLHNINNLYNNKDSKIKNDRRLGKNKLSPEAQEWKKSLEENLESYN